MLACLKKVLVRLQAILSGLWKRSGRPGRVLLVALAAGALLVLFSPLFVPKPDLLDEISFSTVIFDRHGQILRVSLSQDEKYRIRARGADLPPELVEATLRYEDKLFRYHPGVNPLALGRAFLATYFTGNRRLGGSTLTMQLARLRFNLDTTTWSGKLVQILRAVQIEIHYSKDQILEAYFNLAPYGGNVEGAASAALVYYHKPLDRLNLPEILSLVGVPQNPNKRHPAAGNNADLLAVRARVGELWKKDHPEVGQGLLMDGLDLRVYSASKLPFAAPHLTTELLKTAPWPDQIHTTLDSDQQRLISDILRRYSARGRAYGLDNAAAMLVHWPDMEVRALVGSADFHSSAIEGQVDGTLARRSPGSTLKPFIYALALEQGLIHTQTVLIDSPRTFSGYDPENADQNFQGPIPAARALAQSRNIPAIVLAQKLSSPDLYMFLRRAGVAFTHSAAHYGLALVLGGAEVSMRELAGLYGMLANRGLWQPLVFLKDTPLSPAKRLLSPEAAFVTMTMLAYSQGELSNVSRPRRGRAPTTYIKTGTSNGFRDAWAAGVCGPYVLVVWAGNFDNQPNPLLVGQQVAVPLWQDIVNAISAAEPLQDLTYRDMTLLKVSLLDTCAATGDLDTSLCRETARTWFIPGVSPIKSSGVFQSILIDKESGLRACVDEPGRTERVVWEFWPSSLQRIFQQAGVLKPPPPPFLPSCAGQNAPALVGQGPRITVPKPGMVYNLSLSRPERNVIPLTASTDAEARTVFWFANGRFVGRSQPEQAFMWTPDPGQTDLKAMDEFGRISSRRLAVETVP